MDNELLSYPRERVVGIAEDRDTLEAVHHRLEEADVPAERIEVLCGQDAQAQLKPGTDAGEGTFDRIVRTVQKALGDEARRMERLNEAVEAGHFVVQVALPDAQDDEREAAKQTAGRALIDGGANSVAFYGDWQIEQLQLGA